MSSPDTPSFDEVEVNLYGRVPDSWIFTKKGTGDIVGIAIPVDERSFPTASHNPSSPSVLTRVGRVVDAGLREMAEVIDAVYSVLRR
jgi:hypothetical protein